MQGQLSVIIPVYNCLDYLPKAIDSVLQQHIDNIEIIAIDDGSTDGSLEWLQEKALICPMLNVLSQQNQGVVAARNTAINHARGEFVAFLDADDYWLNNKLAAQLSYMQQNKGCVLSFTNYNHMNENYEYIIDCFGYWKCALPRFSDAFRALIDPLNVVLTNNIIGTSSVIVKRQVIIDVGLFDPSLNSASDWDMWLKLTHRGCFAYSPKPLMAYLMRSGSITANRLNRLGAMQTIVKRVEELAKTHALKRAHANIAEGYAEYYREQGLYLKALQYDIKGIWLAPHLRLIKQLCSDFKELVSFKGSRIWPV